MRRLTAFAASAVLSIAIHVTPLAAQSTSGQDLTPEGRGAYVAVAGASELFAIRAAEKALEKAERPEVRTFAQSMLEEHRTSLERLGEVARSVGLGELIPPGMLPMHWAMLHDLDDASSSRVDDVYIDQQVEAHEVAVELHRNFAANGSDARLKEFARASAPTASRHLESARRLDQ